MDEPIPTDRLQAAKAQSTHYMGKPCPKGHSGLRYTISSNCVECTLAASKEYQARIRALLKGESSG